MKGRIYICSNGHVIYTVAPNITWDINLSRSVREIIEAGCPCGAKHEITLDFNGKVEDFPLELGLLELPVVILAGRRIRCFDLSSIPTNAEVTV